MASTIGGISFISIGSLPDPLGQTLENLTKPGEDGHAFREFGKHAAPFIMDAIVDVNNETAVQTLVKDCKALQGTLVTVVDDLGNTWSNVAVWKVRPVHGQKTGVAAGGISDDKGALSRIQFEMLATEELT